MLQPTSIFLFLNFIIPHLVLSERSILGFRHSEILDPRGGQVGSSSGTFRAHSVQLGSDEHQCESQVVVIIAGSYIVSFNKKCLSCQINHFISIFL
jgi:hypothetical protein